MNRTGKSAKAASNAEALDSATSNVNNSVAVVKTNSVQEVEVAGQDIPLTEADKTRLKQLEKTIRDGLNGAYDAFGEIHGKRLYREQYATFAEYCEKEWTMSRSKGQRYVAFIKCLANLKCSQLATNEPLAIPVNELQARKMATLKPELQVEVAKKVAKKTTKPTSRDFDEEVDKHIEDKPRIESYDPRNEDAAEAEKKTEMKSAKVAAPVTIDDGMVSLKDLLALAVLAYNTFSNSSKSKDVEKMLWKLKEGLKEWADWHVNQLNQEVA